MITFEIDASNEGIEIYLDKDGVMELIDYLNYVKDNNEHYHLVIGNELSEKPINNDNYAVVKHVKLIYQHRM